MKMSLRTKTFLLIVSIAIVLIGVAILTSGIIFSNIIDRQYKDKAVDVGKTVALVIDADKVKAVDDAVMAIYDAIPEDKRVCYSKSGEEGLEEYLARFESVLEMQEFKDLKAQMQTIRDANGLRFLYITHVGETIDGYDIIIADADEQEDSPPGYLELIYDDDREDMIANHGDYKPCITNEEFGWLVSAGSPIKLSNGDLHCYIIADVSMNEVRAEQTRTILIVVGILLGLTVIICVIAILIVNKSIIRPINVLSKSAENFYKQSDGDTKPSGFASIDIHTGDEIEALAESIKKMERDINAHIANILSMTDELSMTRRHADQMNELANTDALTGLKNKTAFDIEVKKLDALIADGNAEFAIAMIDLNYLKTTNDNYGHECGDAALKKVAAIISKNFEGMPVYRIGGDEFVVIVEGNESCKILDYVERFRAEIAKTSADQTAQPWLRTSAAIGYSVFDAASDDCVEDVFRLADRAMYKYKRRMKQ